jgi:hypothetical protein
VLEYPQSGERIIGRRNIQGQRASQPSKNGSLSGESSAPGDLWVTELIVTYDGKPSCTVSTTEFNDGKVARETQYFADPFVAPASRVPMGRTDGHVISMLRRIVAWDSRPGSAGFWPQPDAVRRAIRVPEDDHSPADMGSWTGARLVAHTCLIFRWQPRKAAERTKAGQPPYAAETDSFFRLSAGRRRFRSA